MYALIAAALLFAQGRLAQPPTPGMKTDERIAALSKQSAARPSDLHTQNLLAKAYIQKMRETVDFGYLDRASRIVDDVIARDASNFEAVRLRSEIGMERHEFQRVAEYSEEITKLAPNDPWSWGMLGDASMELARYPQAKQAYEKMLALRPDLSSYNRVAYYQFVMGHAEVAIGLMRNAISGGSDSPENTAWCLADLGSMQFKVGKLKDAEASFRQALAEFPNYYPAFAGLGRIHAAQDKFDLAIENYKKAQAAVPMPEYAAALDAIYARLGKPAEAKKQRDLIDVIEKMGRAGNEKTNRNLALIFADEDRDLDRALELVQNEIAVRPDVYTNDALAWVLYKLKKYEAADAASRKAVGLGTPEPMFYFHAGTVALALGRKQEARADLEKALALNPAFDVVHAAAARETLRALQ
jgi:tetratricopeptide (TPR) repeat protein